MVNIDTKVDVGYVVKENITLTSKAIRPTFTVTFVNGENVASKVPKSITVDKGYHLTANDLPDFEVNDGYVKDGWYYDDVKVESGYEVVSSITLTSKVIKLCNIKYISYQVVTSYAPSNKKVLPGYKLTQEDLPLVTVFNGVITDGGWNINGEKCTTDTVINSDVIIEPNLEISNIEFKESFEDLGINYKYTPVTLNNFSYINYTIDGSDPRENKDFQDSINIANIVKNEKRNYEKLRSFNKIKYVVKVFSNDLMDVIYSDVYEAPFSIGVYDVTFADTSKKITKIKDEFIKNDEQALLEAEALINAQTKQGYVVVEWQFNGEPIVFDNGYSYNNPTPINQDMSLTPRIDYKRVNFIVSIDNGTLFCDTAGCENQTLKELFKITDEQNIKSFKIGDLEVLPEQNVGELIIQLDKNKELKNNDEFDVVTIYNEKDKN